MSTQKSRYVVHEGLVATLEDGEKSPAESFIECIDAKFTSVKEPDTSKHFKHTVELVSDDWFPGHYDTIEAVRITRPIPGEETKARKAWGDVGGHTIEVLETLTTGTWETDYYMKRGQLTSRKLIHQSKIEEASDLALPSLLNYSHGEKQLKPDDAERIIEWIKGARIAKTQPSPSVNS